MNFICASVEHSQLYVVSGAGGVRLVCGHRVVEQLGKLCGKTDSDVTAEPTASRMGGTLPHNIRVQYQSHQPTGCEAICRGDVQQHKLVLCAFIRIMCKIFCDENSVTHNRHLNVSGTLRQMRYFGRLYEYSEDNFNDLLEFQAILDRNDNGRTDVFDVRHRMFQVKSLHTRINTDFTKTTPT